MEAQHEPIERIQGTEGAMESGSGRAGGRRNIPPCTGLTDAGYGILPASM